VVVVDEIRRLLHLDNFFVIAIQESGLDVHMVNFQGMVRRNRQ
jgi:hypothetical protein